MQYGKYIIIEYGIGIELAICFDSCLEHLTIANGLQAEVVSAGMFAVSASPTEEDPEDISVSVFGKSITLAKTVRKGIDERFIKRILRHN